MDLQGELQQLSVTSLHQQCAIESERYLSQKEHDPCFCFELFRRAITQRDDTAWDALYTQYRPMITRWVERHPLYPMVDEEAQYFVNWALERMWSVLHPERFESFPDLKSLLRYLKMCVHSVLVDFTRMGEQARALRDETEEAERLPDEGEAGIEEQVLRRARQAELWTWLEARLKTEQERRVAYGSFVLALKPRELFALYPGQFRSVDEIYLVKDNLLARLRRDRDLSALLNS